MLLVMIPVGMVFGVMVAGIFTNVTPKKYESTVILEIRGRESMQGFSGQSHYSTEVGSDFVMKSRNVLLKTVERAGLMERWKMDQEATLNALKRIVEVERMPGTDLLCVRVIHTNNVDARDIADALAKSYRDYRKELLMRDVDKRVSELRKAVRDQEDRVEEARMVMLTITKMKGEGGGSNPVDKEDYLYARRDFETQNSILEQMKVKLALEAVDGEIYETIVVHEEPVIASLPILPNIRFNLVMGGLVGALISPFFALPLMAFLNRRSKRVSLE